jgi:pyridoxamine 5'-phosphate oxidase
MNKREIVGYLQSFIDEVQTAVLATVDEGGKPHMRWVSPVILKGRDGAIFTVTFPGSGKVKNLQANPHVQWMFQTPALNRILMVEGKVNIIDNPSMRSEVLEVLGSRLRAFWKINEDERNLVVLETIIESATYYLPMKGTKEKVSFK